MKHKQAKHRNKQLYSEKIAQLNSKYKKDYNTARRKYSSIENYYCDMIQNIKNKFIKRNRNSTR
ncbi:MAG: hypothetical protein IJ848_03195 [Alphaproteobacteria bacterium]|nr:hypothetical protein [Alphaproteobacteria bacterium]